MDKNTQQKPVINDTKNLGNSTDVTNFDKTTKMQYISVKVTVLIAALFVLGYFGYYAIFKKQPKTL